MYSDELEPEQDFQLFVTNGRCDEVVLECARDKECPAQDYALACLYVISGDVIYSSLDDSRRSAVLRLANRVNDQDSRKIRRWQDDTRKLFDGKADLVYDYWFFGKFADVE
jgi:hypothetical protein